MTSHAAAACAIAAFVPIATATIVACGPHEDVTPQIVVQPGAAARGLALMGRMGANEARKSSAQGDDGSDAGEDDAGDPSKTARLVFACLEPFGAIGALARVPCVATLDAIASPDAGDAGDASDAHAEIVAAEGRVAIALAPGKYRVIASREPDHASARFEVDLAAGATTWGPNEGAVVLARIVDTRGYLVADAASHGFGESDARVVAASWLARFASHGGDVLDVWSTNDADARTHAIADLMARLAAKAPVTAIASGEARTYVRMDDAGQASAWDAKRDADFARGVHDRRDVVLSNGPFLRVTANGAGIGGVAKAAGRTRDVEVIVHVECAPGVTIDRLTILRARGAASELRSIALHDLPHATTGTRAADATFHLRAPTDDALVVIAEGAASAYAMTGALWIDADGDGESLGRIADDTGDPLHGAAPPGKVPAAKVTPKVTP